MGSRGKKNPRREESCSGAAISEVRRGAGVPRRADHFGISGEKSVHRREGIIWCHCASKPFLYTVVSPLLEALFAQYAALSERAQLRGGKTAANRKEELFRGFLALVSEHWLDERELAWYADALCISVHYLCEAVYAVGGHYPKHYIRQTLVSEAKYLLCYTNGSAAAIAAELNFPSPAYFNRFFKRETDLTPGEFRKKNRIP